MSPPSRANKLSRRQLHRINVYASEEFSGPLPHPLILEKYERTLPGAANRIIKMAEKQADHRHIIENRVVKSNTRNEAYGIAVTFTLSMTALCGSIYLIATDKQVAGFLTMISTLLTLAYNFHAKSKVEKETIQKLKDAETVN
jgi:uncharacterized membrane protein